ncbi:MAG TPA: ABC transporter ATP-binding protein [Mycobacteriales bacterium]|nr:ABC transporter ATP-binding protein [Mycobacteriales bacterium]
MSEFSTGRLILGTIRNQKRLFPLAGLGWVLFHAWPLVPGLLGKLFFDLLDDESSVSIGLGTLVALVVAAGLARCGIILGASVASSVVGFRNRVLVQRNVLARLLRLPGAKALPMPVGEAVSTIRDDIGAISHMDDWASDLLAAVVFAGGGIAILLYIDVRVTALVLVPVILISVLAHAVRARARRLRERSRAATAEVTGMIAQIVTAAGAVRAAGAERTVVDRLRILGERRKQAMIRDRIQSLSLDAVFDGTAGLGATLTLLVAAARLRSGAFTTGDFVLFSTYLMQVANYTGFIGYLIRTYQQVGPSFRRSMELMQGAPARDLIARHLPAAPPTVHLGPLKTLAVEGLGYSHGISDASFTIHRGTLTVITGVTGAGKTTLVRALLGLLPAQHGTIRWNGVPVGDPAGVLVPPRVAYTAQNPTLLSGSMRENILLGEADGGRAQRAAARAMLVPDLAVMPEGLDTEIGVRGIRLSGGQVQRVAAARMFARDPELLVVDDLSSALDVETERDLWDGITATGVTCLAVSHRPAVLDRADQVLLMHAGKIVARGRFAELLGQSRNVRELLERQWRQE